MNFLRPPSDNLSVLRGLSASSSKETGLSENNLAFRCTRKRLVIETLHLDVEGGVSERRTSMPAIAVPQRPSNKDSTTGSATMEIEVEQKEVTKAVKAKKKVAFITEKPDIYDF
jgi:elongator complex protein 4